MNRPIASKVPHNRAAKLEAARAGDCVLSFSATLRDRVQALTHDGLPHGKFALIKEFTKTLQSTAEVLRRSTKQDTEVVVDRLQAERIILSLAVLNAPTQSLDGVDDAQNEVRREEERTIIAARELIQLNAAILSEGATFEEFAARAERLSYPDETAQLLHASATGANVELVGTKARIHIKECRRQLTKLPSSRLHILECSVVGAEDTHVGTFNVVLRLVDVVSPQDSVAQRFGMVRSAFVNPDLRRFMLRAFLEGSNVKITVRLPSIPLIRTEDQGLDVDIVEWR